MCVVDLKAVEFVCPVCDAKLGFDHEPYDPWCSSCHEQMHPRLPVPWIEMIEALCAGAIDSDDCVPFVDLMAQAASLEGVISRAPYSLAHDMLRAIATDVAQGKEPAENDKRHLLRVAVQLDALIELDKKL